MTKLSTDELFIIEHMPIEWYGNIEPHTFLWLINEWIGFIQEIERGYLRSWNDYTNDLSIRKLILKVLYNTQSDFYEQINSIVIKRDELFINVTKKVNEPLYDYPSDFWWYWRIPKKLVGEMAEVYLDNE